MAKDMNWQTALTQINTTILSAIHQINNSGWRILLVVDESKHLLGVITDGDIRRHLLKQASLEGTVSQIMNTRPITAFMADSQEQLLMKIHANKIWHLPIVDENNQVVGIETFDSLFAKKTRDNWVVFMAGGQGKRLHPLTLDCPKPLLKLGDRPISEILLENFIKAGFKNFYFSVNYKADMIREYYGSGSRWGVTIQYIEENLALGTAGSLSLLPEKPTQPFFVINADILTNINFGHILDFHQEQKEHAQATVCVRLHQQAIPFGVVEMHAEDHRLISIEEKPKKEYFVNAGIYILEPEALQYLSFNAYCDMPHFLTHLVKLNKYVTTFPIQEYWLDIGHHDHLTQAATDYVEFFS